MRGDPPPLLPLPRVGLGMSVFCASICCFCWTCCCCASWWIWSIVFGALSSRRGTHLLRRSSTTSCSMKRTRADVRWPLMSFSICWKYRSTSRFALSWSMSLPIVVSRRHKHSISSSSFERSSFIRQSCMIFSVSTFNLYSSPINLQHTMEVSYPSVALLFTKKCFCL